MVFVKAGTTRGHISGRQAASSPAGDNPARPRTKSGAASRDRSNEVLPSPFTILVDNNEGTPYYFTGLRADASQHFRPLLVQLEKVSLYTGDYTIKGYEKLLTVERKTLADLFGTVLGGRDRFRDEHERMAEMVKAGGFACVMIEGSLADALHDPPSHPLMTNDKAERSSLIVHRVAMSWPQRYGVHWIWASGRRDAEESTYRLLEKFWQHRQEEKRAEAKR
jgi:ERCC4-type nuclease